MTTVSDDLPPRLELSSSGSSWGLATMGLGLQEEEEEEEGELSSGVVTAPGQESSNGHALSKVQEDAHLCQAVPSPRVPTSSSKMSTESARVIRSDFGSNGHAVREEDEGFARGLDGLDRHDHERGSYDKDVVGSEPPSGGHSQAIMPKRSDRAIIPTIQGDQPDPTHQHQHRLQVHQNWISNPTSIISDVMNGHGHSLGVAPPTTTTTTTPTTTSAHAAAPGLDGDVESNGQSVIGPSGLRDTHGDMDHPPTQTHHETRITDRNHQQHLHIPVLPTEAHSIRIKTDHRPVSGARSDAAKMGMDGQPVGDGDLGGYAGLGGGGDGRRGSGSKEGVNGNGNGGEGLGAGEQGVVGLDGFAGRTINPIDSPRINPLHYFSRGFPSDPSPGTETSSSTEPATDPSPPFASHYDTSGRLVPPVHIAGVYKDHVVFEPGSALEAEEEEAGRRGGKAGAFLSKVGRAFGRVGHRDEDQGGEGGTAPVHVVEDRAAERGSHGQTEPVASSVPAGGQFVVTSNGRGGRSSPLKSKNLPPFTGRGPARRPVGRPNDLDPTAFRRADLDDQDDVAGGAGEAPPSPPISDVIDADGEGVAPAGDEADHEDDSIGMAYGGEKEEEQGEEIVGDTANSEHSSGRAYGVAGRNASVTGQAFVSEPESMSNQLDPRATSPARPGTAESNNRLSPIPLSSSTFPSPPVRSASNASTLSMASTDRAGQRLSGPAANSNVIMGDAVYLAPPILTGQMTRTGSLAIVRNASRQSSRNTQRSVPPETVAARISPEKGASKASSDAISQRPDMFLDSPDPPIPADRADGQWTVPVSGLSLPERGPLTTAGSYSSAYQQPGGTSMMSSSSIASSLGGPPRPVRRSTTGTAGASPNMGRVPLPHSPSSQMVPSWNSGAGSPSGRYLTEVPGLSGQALDSDILAQADRIREERLARRQKKRSSGDEKTFELFVPEAAATELVGPPQSPRSEYPPGRSPSGGVTRRMSRRQSESVGGVVSDMRSLRRLSQKENPLPGHVNPERVLVGNLIGEDHVNYVLMYNMLTGIRIGVSRCQAKIKRPLTEDDYTARHKYSFDIVGNELTPSARYDFKFKDYAPWVFRDLREEYFHLDPADYLLSLTAKYILSELGSPGKSGSFFYFSRDYRFIIKTIHHAEHKFIRSILKDYYEHIKANPHTLISRFYGLHRVKLPRGKKIHFVIMNNLFPPHRDIHETYDLKGSAWHREYPEDMAKLNPKATLKDLNWFHRGRTFNLGPEKKALFSEQLKRDAEFLRRVGVMDYSLLIGIHNMERGNRDNIRENQLSMFNPEGSEGVRRRVSSIKGNSEAAAFRKVMRKSGPQGLTSAAEELPKADSADRRHFLFYQDEGGLRATDDANMALDVIYYLGVIDILTPYDMKKRLEHFWKGLTEDRHLISCQPPDEYADRFLRFLLSFMPGADISQRPKMDSGRPEKPKMD